ncbi:phosphoribosyltransferase [Phaeobacter sp. B1627]|uniref:phosphoribosyltransferase n=1 Tax=Phaeobacter sp. B1627 TaxID=2583809 RepID=UPI001119B88A|nr:phosphoribosyltransferase [Phaeobacter sp. B1627]TNJ40607.1 phosphoribosyltransferase [Phaeobacter sp. B1627]
MRLDVWQDLHDDLRPGVQDDGETFAAELGRQQLLLPIRTLPNGTNGVASLILNQASFSVLDAIADHVAARLRPHAPDVIVAMPTLGLPLGEALARRLGHKRMVPLSTSRKFWYEDALSTPITSITTPDQGKHLYMDPRMVPLLQGARVAVVDDVLSSGKSMSAALTLMAKAGIAADVIGCAMLQGEAWRGVVGRTPVCHAIHTPILTQEKTGWRQ